MENDDETLDLVVHDIEEGPIGETYQPVTLITSRGDIVCRFYRSPGAGRGILLVGGVGGGWDTPARELYPRLCEDLLSRGISSLRVRFRSPAALEEAVLDVLAGLVYLQEKGVVLHGLVGHSFGGAVVVQAAASAHTVQTVVTLATQSYGIDPISQLGPRCSTLLVHGEADKVLPPACSVLAHRLAENPKRLVIYTGARHGLEEVADELHTLLLDWIAMYMPEAPPGSDGSARAV